MVSSNDRAGRPARLLRVPRRQDVSGVCRAGVLLTLRTVSTIFALSLSTAMAARLSGGGGALGTLGAAAKPELAAAHQICFQLWSLRAYMIWGCLFNMYTVRGNQPLPEDGTLVLCFCVSSVSSRLWCHLWCASLQTNDARP